MASWVSLAAPCVKARDGFYIYSPVSPEVAELWVAGAAQGDPSYLPSKEDWRASRPKPARLAHPSLGTPALYPPCTTQFRAEHAHAHTYSRRKARYTEMSTHLDDEEVMATFRASAASKLPRSTKTPSLCCSSIRVGSQRKRCCCPKRSWRGTRKITTLITIQKFINREGVEFKPYKVRRVP